MESKNSQIRAAGLGLAAVSYDSPAILKAFSNRMHIEFPLISDKDSAIIKRFGIFNDTMKPGTAVYGIPYPGIYILDAKGNVKSKFFEDDFRQRDTAGQILLEQFGIQPEAPHMSVTAKHITLSAGATDPEARMGHRISLLLDGVLPKNVHVYAPGVKGYIAIDWQIPDSPAFKADPVVYPASKLMRLEAIKETVPVYAEHFQLSRKITLGSDKEIAPLVDKNGNLTIAGTFRYQACDDEKCFIPETLPINVTLHFKPLDQTRAPESLQHKPAM